MWGFFIFTPQIGYGRCDGHFCYCFAQPLIVVLRAKLISGWDEPSTTQEFH